MQHGVPPDGVSALVMSLTVALQYTTSQALCDWNTSQTSQAKRTYLHNNHWTAGRVLARTWLCSTYTSCYSWRTQTVSTHRGVHHVRPQCAAVEQHHLRARRHTQHVTHLETVRKCGTCGLRENMCGTNERGKAWHVSKHE